MTQLLLKRRFPLLLAMLILVLGLTAEMCGNGNGNGPSPTATATATATPNSSQFISANPPASETVNGLEVQLLGLNVPHIGLNVTVPATTLPTLGATCGSELVLTTPAPTSLPASAVQQMTSYLLQLPTDAETPYPAPTVEPPSGLNWLPDADECGIVLQITNVTSNTNIQINGLDLQLAAQPVPVPAPSGPDSLVDVCTLPIDISDCASPGEGPGYSVYDAQVDLHGGNAGSTFPATLSVSPFADPTQYTLPFILAPGDTRAIALTVTAPNGTAMAYQVVPELAVLDQSGSTRFLPFPTLESHLVLAALPAAANQWHCYGLLTGTGRVVPDSQVHYGGGAFGNATHSMCV
jgi:hypothetical protein